MFAVDKGAPGGWVEKSKHVGQSFELLPISERLQQYRDMADATFLKAQKIEDPEMRDQYLSMASNWHALAQQLEAGNPDPQALPPVQDPVPPSHQDTK